jgi:SAM-dependent methyltransferase
MLLGRILKSKQTSDCPLCRSSSKREAFTLKEGRSVLRCSACRLLFYAIRPTNAELQAHYSVYSYSSQKEIPFMTYASMLEVLSEFELKIKARPIRLLDYGCGQGDFLLLAESRGWEVKGIEFSKSGRDLCATRGLKSIFANVYELDRESSNDRFDLITSFEVLEHLMYPGQFFDFARRSLRVGGYALVTTPNANSLSRFVYGWGRNLRYPEHINSFSSGTFQFISRRFSMHLERLETRGLSSRLLLSIREKVRPRSSEGYGRGIHKFEREITYMANYGRKHVSLTGQMIFLARFMLNLFLKIIPLGETIRVIFRVEDQKTRGKF